ncbi:hypothetical protein OAD38_08615 [Ascidiaceihabitans sp.]|jgi:hypothetical protein|nr:hypothetical protein [Amylibacter sp.]MDB9946412.1 hypothetical protein [Ascidiaceihabitans sp.]
MSFSKNMFVFLFGLFVFTAASFANEVDENTLPSIEAVKSRILDKMPKPTIVKFDPVSIENYRQELNEFREWEIEWINKLMTARSIYLNKLDADIRKNLKGPLNQRLYTWEQYEVEIKPRINSALLETNIENRKSQYTQLYLRAQERLRGYGNQYRQMHADCRRNRDKCRINNV